MRSRIRARGFALRTLGCGIVLAMVGAGLVPVAAVAAPQPVPDVAADEATAKRYAALGDKPVRVALATSESEELYANPDGTMTYTQHVQPVRAKRDGVWVPIDLTLEHKPDGTIAPKAAPVAMEFSSGGVGSARRGPVAKLADGDREVGFSWPEDLPEPTLSETTVTYPEVFPGVDLKVEAGLRGFSEVLVVKTPQAADHPELRTIDFRSHTENVRIEEVPSGLAVKDEAGNTVFAGDASRMWDSSGESEEDRTDGPTPGDRRATMDVEVTPDTVAVTPDQAFLDDPATTYPVHIDPNYSCTTCGKAHHVVVQSPWPDARNFDATTGMLSDLKVGYVNGDELQSPNGEAGTSRTYVQMNTGAIIGKHIESATLKARVIKSYSCSPSPTSVHLTNWVDANTTWRNQTPWMRHLDTNNRANNPGANCASDGTANFNVMSAIEEASAKGWGITTFVLAASNEEDLNRSWRRFDLNPYLEVVYNSYPNPPSDMSMEAFSPDGAHTLPCRVGANRAFVFTRTPKLSARLSDPDQGFLDAAFKLYSGTEGALGDENQFAQFTAIDIPSNSIGSAFVPGGYIKTDGIYTWRVWAGDRQFHTWSPYCEFEVDTVRPNIPAVFSNDYPTSGVHGSVGHTGNFTFKVNGNTGRDGSMDIVRYTWSLNGGSGKAHTVDVASSDGTVTVPITPTRAGTNVLYVNALDRAGNSSGAPAEYRFEVTPPLPALAEWKLDEISGDTAADTGAGNRPLTLSGGAEFAPAYAGNGLKLNGDSAAAASASSIVDTARAFSVGAWVKLERTDGYFTVLSQDGNRVSPFYLQYDPAVNRWRISATERDADSPPAVSINSLDAPEVGAWTHLLATYEPNSRNATLYVNGKAQGSVAMSFWQAAGSLVVGAARWNGARANHFPGAVDHVQLWDRELGADDAAAATNLAVPRARYLLDERSGGTTREEVSGANATLAGGVAWAGAAQSQAASEEKWLNYDASGTGEVTGTLPGNARTDRSYTVTAWVRHGELDSSARAAVSIGDTKYSPFLLGYRPETGKWGFLVSKSATTGDGWTALSDKPATAGEWVHLAATYDAVTGGITLYVNGVKQSTFSNTPDGTGIRGWQATGPLWIGRGIWEGRRSDAWKGDVDDVRMYSGVLTSAEINLLFDNTFHY
ncbi:hypothetical protein JOF41_003562 [Saccharothrix coeruleofusca]|uniref:LamG domain-containing protein n=1 Tax=Saccharothrix coeruleofusca TaxID=33919 RepID=UPI001AEADB55|nr:LamG domain-containing protein [Saccharothrix coeruleofusca]MBP2337384.1 hypothetical protein [Saccharothrix coeruleofusca]